MLTGWTTWNLAFTTGMAQKPRLRPIPARDLDALEREIQRAKHRFGLPEEAPVVSCYEAGRDGFWLHRYLDKNGTANLGRRPPELGAKPPGPTRQERSARRFQTLDHVDPLSRRRAQTLERGPNPLARQ